MALGQRKHTLLPLAGTLFFNYGLFYQHVRGFRVLCDFQPFCFLHVYILYKDIVVFPLTRKTSTVN